GGWPRRVKFWSNLTLTKPPSSITFSPLASAFNRSVESYPAKPLRGPGGPLPFLGQASFKNLIPFSLTPRFGEVPERYSRNINCFDSFLRKKVTFEAFFG